MPRTLEDLAAEAVTMGALGASWIITAPDIKVLLEAGESEWLRAVARAGYMTGMTAPKKVYVDPDAVELLGLNIALWS